MNSTNRAFCFILCLMLVAMLVMPTTPWRVASAQQVEGTTHIEPNIFKLELPDGKVELPKDVSVLTEDEEGKGVVARVYCQVGDNYIVLLPDGQLVGRGSSEAKVTDRPFEPLAGRELAERLSGEFPGFQTKVSRHFVFVYDCSDSFVELCSALMESMIDGVSRYMVMNGLTPHEPQLPLVVVAFRTEQQFQRYGRTPPGVVAYYNHLSNRVILYEGVASLTADLAQAQLISTIAHEATHQILHNIGIQKRLSRWPMWLSEGIAEFLSPTDVSRKMRWKGAGQINDMRMFELELYLQSRAYAGLDGDTLKKTVLANTLDSTGYASAWCLTHFLARTKKDEFRTFLRLMTQVPPLEGFINLEEGATEVDANLEHFTKHFGNDFPAMETDLVEHLAKQEYVSPLADYPHAVALLIYRRDGAEERRACVFPSATMAQQWVDEYYDYLDNAERNSAKTELMQFQNRDAAMDYVNQFFKSRPTRRKR
jgi:hypothetical protein